MSKTQWSREMFKNYFALVNGEVAEMGDQLDLQLPIVPARSENNVHRREGDQEQHLQLNIETGTNLDVEDGMSESSLDEIDYMDRLLERVDTDEFNDDSVISNLNNVDDVDYVSKLSLTEKIAEIGIMHNVSHVVLHKFAKLFVELGHDIPIDPRTILKTSQCAIQQSDSFAHVGLEKGILNRLKNGISRDVLELKGQVNIDGIPLFKSSKTSFWPILVRITNCLDTRPFAVSVYCGPSKPESLDDYLEPFMSELKHLERNGIIYEKKNYRVDLSCFICDAPARAFIKGIVGHNAKRGCERCHQEGKIVLNRMTFSNVNNATLRTNDSFRCGFDKRHHKEESPILCLNIDMIKGFPLDYMHLVCLGVVKRWLTILTKGFVAADRKHLLNTDQIAIVNQRIDLYSKCFPSEFNRKGRSLNDLCRWKAVEFRNFLLYTGPLILKGILSDDKYNHFITLHTSFRILLSSSLTKDQSHFAKQCLEHYVFNFGIIYGAHHMVYNIHSLSHIADDCIFYDSPLDDFSSFPFENYLGQLKKLLRGTRKPLAQLCRRLSEIDNNSGVNKFLFHSRLLNQKLKVISSIKPNSRVDCFYMIKKGIIIKVTDILPDKIVGFRFFVEVNNDLESEEFERFFHKPVDSFDLNIYVGIGMDNETTTYLKSEVEIGCKCMIMSYFDSEDEQDKFLIQPLLHQNDRV